MLSLTIALVLCAPAPFPKTPKNHVEQFPIGKWVSPGGSNNYNFYEIDFGKDGYYKERAYNTHYLGTWHYDRDGTIVAIYRLVNSNGTTYPEPVHRATYYRKNRILTWTGIPFSKVK